MKSLPAFSATPLALIAAAVLSLATPCALAQAAAAASAASAPAYSVRPEVGAALQQAVDLFRGGNTAEAKARVEQTLSALTNPEPAERTVLLRLRGLFALQMDHLPEGVQALEAALAVNVQSPQDSLLCQESLARANFNLKAYPAAIDWARKAQAAGSSSAPVQVVLVRSTYLMNDFPGTIKLLEAQQQRDGKLSMEDLRLLASSYGQNKDDANYMRLAEQLLREHGRTEYWPDLLTRVQRQPGWQPRWDVDLYRLRLRLDLMDDVDDYLVLADTLARSGLPAEAQKVLDAGYAKGLLGKGSRAAEHDKLRASVTKQAADDRQNLASAATRPPEVADAKSATITFNTGAALAGSGQAAQGLELMKAALGGPLPDPAQSRLQYAQALAQAGRSSEAAEQFKALAGQQSLGLLARLWQAAVAAK